MRVHCARSARPPPPLGCGEIAAKFAWTEQLHMHGILCPALTEKEICGRQKHCDNRNQSTKLSFPNTPPRTPRHVTKGRENNVLLGIPCFDKAELSGQESVLPPLPHELITVPNAC